MPALKTQLKTNSAGLRQRNNIPYSRPTETNYDEGYLPLRATTYPQGTPVNSIRSKKIYSDLSDERMYLSIIKEQWEKKLSDLQEDNLYLKRMRDVKKSEVRGIGPLLTKQQTDPAHNVSQSPHLQPDLSSQPVHSISTQYVVPPLTLDITSISQPSPTSSPTSLPTQLMQSIQLTEGEAEEEIQEEIGEEIEDKIEGEDEDEIEEEEDEDEERARIALNLMLQQFGDSI